MMQKNAYQSTSTITVLLLMFATAPAANAADAGSVIFATGSVSAERAPVVTLAKGDAVFAEDTIVTGEASRAQLLMLDGGKIAIRPNSRLRIDEFEYAVQATGATAVTTSNEKSVMSLVKGGFRSITGAIGKKDESDYEVRTAVGVLGIRGTDFTMLFCNSDCAFAPGVVAGAPVEDGLYLGVNKGVIVFRNEIAAIELSAGEFAFIPLSSRTPTPLDSPPSVLLDDNDLRFDVGTGASQAKPGGDAGLSGFDSKLGPRRTPPGSAPDPETKDRGDDSSQKPPSQPVIGIDADGNPVDLTPGVGTDPAGNRTIAFSIGPLGAAATVLSSALDNVPDEYQLDSGNNLTGFAGEYPGGNLTGPASFDIGSAANVDTGFDGITVLRWGRWAGGTANITLPDGSDASQSLAAQSIHWISGPANATPPVMPVTGVANYSLIGATSPTDNLGNTGFLGNASFRADFTNMRVNSTLSIDINGANWNASGIGNIGSAAAPVLPAHLFNGLYNSVSVSGIAGGSGVFSGFFSEPGATSDPAFPGGVGLTYSLQDPAGSASVSGAAVFGNP